MQMAASSSKRTTARLRRRVARIRGVEPGGGSKGKSTMNHSGLFDLDYHYVSMLRIMMKGTLDLPSYFDQLYVVFLVLFSYCGPSKSSASAVAPSFKSECRIAVSLQHKYIIIPTRFLVFVP